ncbi:ACP S-malonyltransferase [Alteromonas sp. a30]|uniref:ACP S-malonyltransferase n=1 Tax=Alteromonas sp. a30 TaxID=2730917 RepID=UPI002281EFF8|nr:ACP S-malonyltransferase [Alteromonas sp. a30]MCY7296755.1 ACP S-malonyltransferase [Alteromonas sp. a30]
MKAYVFPGQGAQAKGMGANLFDEFPELTNKADCILGYSIKELCVEDPLEQLGDTKFTQPALYVVNALSYFKEIQSSGVKPDFVAGHSLGEYNALLAAEAFSFETGLMLVKKRGDLMSQARGGGMAAIVNSSKEEIEAALKENGLNNVQIANFNSPKQIVISGMKEEVEKFQPIIQQGRTIFVALKTSGAFHSRFMQDASEKFNTFLQGFIFANLNTPVISNVTAMPYKNGEIVDNLSQQITHSVRWTDSVDYMMQQGVTDFVELGNGNVLTKLLRDIKKAK